MLLENPLRTLFRRNEDGSFELKPPTSSPPDKETRDIVSDMDYSFDPDQEALPKPADAITVLKEIRDILKDANPNPPADNYRPMALTLNGTAASEQTLDITGGWNYLYVPPVPRVCTLFWGASNIPLALLQAGQAANVHIPFRLDQLRVTWGAGIDKDTLYLIFTTDPISIDILAY